LSLLGIALFVLVSACSLSDSVSGQEIAEGEVLKSRTDIVTVPFVVTDARGRRVSGVQQSDLILSSDGRTQRIEFLSAGTSRVALIFLLDASGSARQYISDQRDAALSLFSRFGPKSEVAVLRFNDITNVAAPFLADVETAREAFAFPAMPERRTAIFNAALSAVQLFSERREDPAERRIVILTSDGLDTASNVKGADVIEQARNAGVSFYVIHFPIYTPQDGRLQPRPAARDFRSLAEKTGGRYFIAGDVKSALSAHPQYDLTPIFKSIEDDLAAQYLIGFYPEAAFRDGRPHQIELNAINKVRVKTLRREFILVTDH
jgi:VWFA-related protein